MTEIEKVNGIGAFFYPFLVLVSKNKPGKHSPELKAPTSPRIRLVKLIHQIPTGEKILISDDGFVGVFDNDKKSARHLLNTIFATAITYGIGSEFLTSVDICKFVYDRVRGSIVIGYSNRPSERTMFAFQRDEPREAIFQQWRDYKSRTGYHPDVIRKIFDTVSDYIKNPSIRQDLILLLEGYTLYYREAYRGAYLYGWMLIETFLSKLWEEYVKSLERSQSDKISLMDNRSWTSYHHIEMFSALEKMSPVVRNLLHALRKKRNLLVHEKLDPDEEEAFECLNLAKVMNLNMLRNPSEPFSRVEKEIKLIQKWRLDK